MGDFARHRTGIMLPSWRDCRKKFLRKPSRNRLISSGAKLAKTMPLLRWSFPSWQVQEMLMVCVRCTNALKVAHEGCIGYLSINITCVFGAAVGRGDAHARSCTLRRQQGLCLAAV